ncbi:antibiotic biosynthesis monooxygenase family protein [Enterococcus sp. HY326]|uniref:antibiotic biosynthesis monooxygenase family protein n=1 Tax=Enterococcus sp. HY326 TaxID=2971265 RepID=UPI00223EDE3F|nr:antibiotic biosynthesis monooxygenase family protein [Enterococcus sp. HY326]
MIIKTVTFEVVPEGKGHFQEKIKKDLASLKTAAGCLSSEAWLQENKRSIVFQLVSKWQDKKDFQNWLKRPEHLAEHWEAHLAKEHAPKLVIQKTMAEFVPLDD